MRTKYKKKIKNGKEYFFYRLRHKNLEAPKDIYAKTVKELNEKIKKITNLLDQEIDANNETFGEFFDWWIENIKIPKIKPQTKENTLNRYKRIKKYSICKIKLKDLKIKNIQDFYNKLSNEDIKYSTIKRIESLINQAFKYAYNQRYIEREFKGAYTIKKEKEVKEQKIKVYSIEEQKKLEKIIKGNKHEMLYITLLYTGIRLGEALALKWEDINFEEEYININKTTVYIRENNIYKTIIGTPKTKASIRKVNMPTNLVKKIKEYKKEQNKIIVRLGNKFERNNIVFCDYKGNYIVPNSLRKSLRELLKNTEIEYKGIHVFRHTYATRLFEKGAEPKTVQTLLGHETINTTLNIYTHVMPEKRKETVELLNDLI